jgi:hypothetical protein
MLENIANSSLEKKLISTDSGGYPGQGEAAQGAVLSPPWARKKQRPS